jgi:hypothetical protein
MKVTKLIREYVEEQVAKVYNSKTNPYSEQAKLDRQMIEDFKTELHRQQKEAIEKFNSENELLNSWNDYQPCKISTSVPGFSHCVTKAMMNEELWKKENARLKAAKIRDIMLALELGANRQELNDMIAKLMEE